MLVSMVRPEQTVRIAEIRGGRGLIRRLAYMGLYPRVGIEVIDKRRGGARLGLGYGMAHRIFVSPIP